MTIVFLSHLFPNELDPNCGIFVLEEVQALRRLGANVLVVSPTPWAPTWLRCLRSVRKYLVIPRQSTVDGLLVQRPRVPTLPRNRLFAVSGLLFYLASRQVIGKLIRHTRIDVIHAHTALPDGFAAVLLGREFRLPVVCTVHGSDVNVYPFTSRSVRWVTKWALQKIGFLVAVSDNLRNVAIHLLGARQATVIHNGADSSVFTATRKSDARRSLRLPQTGRVICSVGYLRPEKGLEYLLEAFASLDAPDIMLCIVGDGSLRETLVGRAERLGILSTCLFVGNRPHDEIPLWLSAADCLVLCSLSEGLPTILPEAMLCRTAIIATPVGGVPEIIRHGETGLIVPCSDSAALTDALRLLLSSPDVSLKITDRAEAFARSTLTWEANARQTLAVYEAAMKASTPAPA